MNVHSIKSRIKFSQLKLLLNDLKYNFDIIALVETNLDEGTGDFYNLGDSYKTYHNIRSRSGGSSVVFIRKSIDSSQEYISDEDEIEFTVIKLIRENINFCLTYRPPVNSAVKYEKFFERLDFVLGKFKQTILVGDMNINLLCPVNPNQLFYTNLLNSHNFSILNLINSQMVTRVDTDTIIDHAATDLEGCDMVILLGDDTLSDHRFVIIGIGEGVAISSAGAEVETYTIINYSKLSKSLPQLEHSADFNTFCLDLHAKVKENTRTRPVSSKIDNPHLYPYFTEELKKVRKLRNKFYILKNKYPTIDFYKTNFIHYKYLLLKNLEIEKQKYYSSEIKKVIKKPKKLWAKMREIMTHKKSANDKISIILKHDNTLYESPNQVSAIINDFFAGVGSKITNNIPINLNYTIGFFLYFFTPLEVPMLDYTKSRVLILNLVSVWLHHI